MLTPDEESEVFEPRTRGTLRPDVHNKYLHIPLLPPPHEPPAKGLNHLGGRVDSPPRSLQSKAGCAQDTPGKVRVLPGARNKADAG